ncbi:MAG: dihydroorotate dehydrogenase electron transfer subunit [Candidatus Aminicenantes bacterium]|nr:dihydroorotate dehydrogenase electron transfer subunit [Candidatus Aminicenantes bacterium]
MPHDPAVKIIKKQSWGDYHLFRFETPALAAGAEPGQFLMVRVSDTPFPLLRRPISLHAKEKNSLEIFFQVAGQGTALLAQKKEGETLDILGPFGKRFIPDTNALPTPAVLVGGGRGIAPLYFLAMELNKLGARVKVLYGGKSRTDLPVREKFEKAGLDIVCSTDDGSFGHHGFVTGLLESEIRRQEPAILYVCGPDPMMKKTAEIAAARRIPARISLESMMGCGFGACWGCVKRIRRDEGGEWRKICEDGPVFWADKIIWEEKE